MADDKTRDFISIISCHRTKPINSHKFIPRVYFNKIIEQHFINEWM